MASVTLEKVLAGGAVPPVLVVAGEGEDALEAVARIREALVEPSLAGLNVVSFTGSETGVEAVLGAARTQAFGGGGRLVVLRDPGAMSPSDRDRLADYLASPAAGNCLVVVAGSLDRRQRLWREAANRGWAVEPRAGVTRRQLIVEALRRVGLAADEDALRVLEESLPDDRGIINREAEKLSLAAGGAAKKLTPADLGGLVGGRAPVETFDVTRRLQAGDVAGALRVLDRLLEEGVEPVPMIGLLAREYRLLLQALAVSAGKGAADTLPEFGKLPEGARRAVGERARKLGREEVRAGLLGLREVDRRLKSTGVSGAFLLEAFLAGRREGQGRP